MDQCVLDCTSTTEASCCCSLPSCYVWFASNLVAPSDLHCQYLIAWYFLHDSVSVTCGFLLSWMLGDHCNTTGACTKSFNNIGKHCWVCHGGAINCTDARFCEVFKMHLDQEGKRYSPSSTHYLWKASIPRANGSGRELTSVQLIYLATGK